MSFVLTSLSGNLISAASAAYAPTNSADVSAIASAYATGKQDTLTFAYDDDKISAINGSALAGQGGGGGLVTAIGTSESGITSINNTGLVDTAALRSADYSSLYVQEPLYISASGDSSYIGISGDIGGIDSATCSAIASAYAESAASGKLDSSASSSFYSTANESGFLTGLPTNIYVDNVNASGHVRATATGQDLYGNFDYAGMYFRSGSQRPYNIGIDNTGANFYIATAKKGFERIYASSIQSWNGKLDGSASSSYYTTSNESGYVDSAYVESQVSGKQDTLTFDWDADSAISSINGSALAGQGGGASITAVSYDTSTHQSSIVTATGFGIVGSATNYPRISSVHLTDGQTRHLEANTLAPGAAQTASGKIPYTLLFSPAISMWTTADAATGIYSPLQYGTGAGLFMDSNNFKGYIKGNELFISNTAIGRAARLEVHQSRGSRLGLTGQNGSEKVNLTESELTIVNSALSTATLGRTKLEFKSPVSGTGTYATNYINLYDMAESATKTISSTSIDYWNGKADSSALSSYALSADVSGTVDLVSTQSANWGGSALALSAGPGVKLEKVGDTLVASTDETLLWSGSSTGTTPGFYLNEPYTNFEYIRIDAVEDFGFVGSVTLRTQNITTANRFSVPIYSVGSYTKGVGIRSIYFHPTSNVYFNSQCGGFDFVNSYTTNDKTHVTTIVGINRTAEA